VRRSLSEAALVALALLAAPARGQERAAEALSEWQFFAAVERAPEAWAVLTVPPEVFGKARADLADLRLLGAGGREVPYALRVRRGGARSEALEAKTFNRVVTPAGAAELSLDLGEPTPEHNQIDLSLAGASFRRAVRLEGADRPGDWKVLLDGRNALRDEADGQRIDVHRFRYPPSRYRYLRVTVAPDPAEKADGWQRRVEVTVLHAVETPGVEAGGPVNVSPREAVPTAGRLPASMWYLTFDGVAPPVEELRFRVGTDEFVRPYVVEAENGDGSWDEVARGEWRRLPGEADRPMRVRLQREVQARRLKLTVTDQRNPPLHLLSAEYAAPARQLLFTDPAGPNESLRLYFGNPSAVAPGYELDRTLTAAQEKAAAPARLGPVEANPDYRPPPKPWTERWPGLIYAALGGTSLVLLGLLGLIARRALARHDQATAAGAVGRAGGEAPAG
jgi:hypothetical protein